VLLTPASRHACLPAADKSPTFLVLLQGNGGFLSGFVGALWPMPDNPAGGAAGHFTSGPRADAGLRGIGDASPLLMPGVRRPCLLQACQSLRIRLTNDDICRVLLRC